MIIIIGYDSRNIRTVLWQKGEYNVKYEIWNVNGSTEYQSIIRDNGLINQDDKLSIIHRTMHLDFRFKIATSQRRCIIYIFMAKKFKEKMATNCFKKDKQLCSGCWENYSVRSPIYRLIQATNKWRELINLKWDYMNKCYTKRYKIAINAGIRDNSEGRMEPSFESKREWNSSRTS